MSGPMWMRPRSAASSLGGRREPRQARQREVHLGRHARRAEVAGPLHVLGVQGDRVEQPKQGRLGIDRRGHGGGLDLLAARQDDTGDAPVLQQQPLDGRARADLGAEAAGSARECGRERPEASLHEHGREGAVAVAGRGLQQQVRGRARRPRPRHHALDAPRRNEGRQERRLEPLLREVGDGHRAPAQQVLAVRAPEPAQRPAEAGEREQVAQLGALDVGRRQLQQAPEHRREPPERRVELGIASRILRGEAADPGGRACRVAEEAEGAAVRERGEGTRLRQDPLEAVPAEPQRPCEPGPQRACRVGHCRRAEAGVELLRDGRAAQEGAPLEKHRLAAALREERRGREAVRAAAHHDDVGLHRAPPTSFSTSSAASRPGAPMIPPPGCVAEPHM